MRIVVIIAIIIIAISGKSLAQFVPPFINYATGCSNALDFSKACNSQYVGVIQ